MSAVQVFLISVIVPLVVGCIPAVITYLLGRRAAAVEPDKIRADTIRKKEIPLNAERMKILKSLGYL